MTYTRCNFQRRSVERTLDRHESLINYANHLRTTAALPSFPLSFAARTRNPKFPFPLYARHPPYHSLPPVLVWPRPISRPSNPPCFFPLASETTRLARGLFIKTFELTRFRRVRFILSWPPYIYIYTYLCVLFIPISPFFHL